MASQTQQPSRARIAAPLIAFVVVSAIASPLLAALQDASGLDPKLLRLTVFSTAVGVAAVWLVFRRRLAYPGVTQRSLAWPLAATVVACALLAASQLAFAHAVHGGWKPASLASLGAPWPLFILVQFAGAAAEEVGWRGLVQPLLERRLPLPAAALATGGLFAVGHAFLLPDVGWGAFLLFCVSAVAVSITLAALTVGRSAAARVGIASLAHFLTNMTTFALFSDGDGSVLYFAGSAAASTLAAVVVWGWWRRRSAAPSSPASA